SAFLVSCVRTTVMLLGRGEPRLPADGETHWLLTHCSVLKVRATPSGRRTSGNGGALPGNSRRSSRGPSTNATPGSRSCLACLSQSDERAPARLEHLAAELCDGHLGLGGEHGHPVQPDPALL